MSGHSHWAGIKHKKGVADQKRGQLFSKLLTAIAAAARTDPNPQFNPSLRSALDRAKEYNVPQENIDRVIRRASEAKNLEELVLEAYGPEGAALLIEAITDSKNRTVAEIKKVLSDHGGKWAEPGSVMWAFALAADERGQEKNAADSGKKWMAKFPMQISDATQQKLNALVEALAEHDDVQGVYTNTQ